MQIMSNKSDDESNVRTRRQSGKKETKRDNDRKESKSIIPDAKKDTPYSRKYAFYLLAITIIFSLVKWKIYDRLQSSGAASSIKNDENHLLMTDETLRSMLSIESRVKINKDLNVAVGFGSCMDIFVSSRNLILDKYQAPQTQRHHENIRSQDELNEVLAYFFAEGAAAERYIDNRTFFRELVQRAESVDGIRKAIGGNAATMAKRFVIEGLDKVMLGSQHSRSSIDHFIANLDVSGPSVDQDDVHICIEYPAGEQWGNYKAPRANRLIIHSDHHNPMLESIENFIRRLEKQKDNLDLLVIGGLQMMDNLPIPMEVRREKLQRFSNAWSQLKRTKTAPGGQPPMVHMELASFTEQALLDNIRELVMPHVDSLGMNEQELPTMLNYLSKGGVNIRSESHPRVATTLDQMRQLYQLAQAPTRGKLNRIHAHTLAFQAIMTRKGSPWKNSLTSSVKAALTAHRYTCGSDEIDRAKTKLIMDESYTTSKLGSRRRIPFDPKHPVKCWEEDIIIPGGGLTPDGTAATTATPKTDTIEICVAPVLVCTKVIQTGGAGDNVSAAGLIFQL